MRQCMLLLVFLRTFSDAYCPSLLPGIMDATASRLDLRGSCLERYDYPKQVGRARPSTIRCKSGPDASAIMPPHWKPQLKRPVLVLLGKKGQILLTHRQRVASDRARSRPQGSAKSVSAMHFQEGLTFVFVTGASSRMRPKWNT